MGDPFVAEIRIFALNFPVKGWAWCDGQLLPISQNTALFAILGTFYGGDGKSTFALPNLQGCAAMHAGGSGSGPGLSNRFLGEQGGTETVTLLESEIPVHTHGMLSAPSQVTSDSNLITGNSIGKSSQGNVYIAPAGQPIVDLSFEALAPAGGDQPHNNMMPYATFYFQIALQGVFPPRC